MLPSTANTVPPAALVRVAMATCRGRPCRCVQGCWAVRRVLGSFIAGRKIGAACWAGTCTQLGEPRSTAGETLAVVDAGRAGGSPAVRSVQGWLHCMARDSLAGRGGTTGTFTALSFSYHCHASGAGARQSTNCHVQGTLHEAACPPIAGPESRADPSHHSTVFQNRFASPTLHDGCLATVTIDHRCLHLQVPQ